MFDYDSFAEEQPDETAHAQWRAQLLAFLAVERAELLQQLLGLDEEALASAIVFDDYTHKDLLAHVGAWDEVNEERLQLALAGRASEIPRRDTDEYNARLHRERRAWPLEQVISSFLEARRGFNEVLAQVPDAMLHQPLELAGGEAFRPRRWGLWRARHDATHAKDLMRWRKEAALPYRPGPKALLLAAMTAGRDEIGALAGLVPAGEEDKQLITEEWTLKDVVGHVADWEQYAVDSVRAGQMVEMEYGGDNQRWNAAHAAARREQPWQPVWQDFVGVRDDFIELLRPLSRAGLAADLPNKWGEDTSLYRWAHWFLEHEQEHTEAMRKALLPI